MPARGIMRRCAAVLPVRGDFSDLIENIFGKKR
jgi:hypothetical protein